MASHGNSRIRGALMVGSAPLATAADVFTAAARQLGSHLRRLPDGETGPRINWTQWQVEVFRAVDGLEAEIVDSGYIRREKFRLKAGTRASDLKFGPLGYSKAAIESYRTFKRLKEAGTIRAETRFQVCLPTPLAPVIIYVFPDDQRALEPVYEAAMLAELDAITSAIPAGDLAIQWDTAIEFALLEGVFPHKFRDDPSAEILARLIRIGDRVPSGVQLGFHLCYGDSGGRHFKQPEDTGKLVAVANGLAAALHRPLDWLHLPVPRERSDDDYFRPLGALRLKESTELYLGLIHQPDDEDKLQARIAAALRSVKSFGVATECGFGRRDAKDVPPLLKRHADIAQPIFK